MIVAATASQVGARLAIFGFVLFFGLTAIDRLPRRTERPPGAYARGKLRAVRLWTPIALVVGVIGLGLWVFAR